VLFLDEFPEFAPHVLEQLREPLETGEIHLARSGGSLTLPAAFQLVAAMNPCPCGAAGSRRLICRCTPEARHRYLQRLSGPLLDRIDLVCWLEPPDPASLLETPVTGRAAETSAMVRERVMAARQIALDRQGVPNARLSTGQLTQVCTAESAALRLLAQTARQLNWSGRAVHRVLRVARSIADLDAEAGERITSHHMAEAIQSRRLPALEAVPGNAGRAIR
jgi:magnesium chelatase family protein